MEISAVIRAATRNQQFMDGTTRPVRGILDACDIVFAIWPDATKETGVGLLVVKGINLVKNVAASERAQLVRWSAVWVDSFEMAAATCEVLGDQATLH